MTDGDDGNVSDDDDNDIENDSGNFESGVGGDDKIDKVFGFIWQNILYMTGVYDIYSLQVHRLTFAHTSYGWLWAVAGIAGSDEGCTHSI